MLKIFCCLKWHTWEYQDGGHRKCKHCGKRQCYIRVGNDGGGSNAARKYRKS